MTGSATEGETGHEQMGLVSEFNLSELVEEVVESVHTGHIYQKKLSASFKTFNTEESTPAEATPVKNGYLKNFVSNHEVRGLLSVILDISGKADRRFKSQAGAWRRIVMNLFGNALKYTQEGFIRISVRSTEISASEGHPDQTLIQLSVSDSGIGISEEYLKHRLFTPFAQEDSLSAGAGLGLSIIQQIVTSLGGTIDIQSELGVGTNVTVSVPLTVSKSPPPASEVPVSTKKRPRWQGLKICFVGFAFVDSDHAANELVMCHKKRALALKLALTHAFTEWFGMNAVSANAFDSVTADVFVIQQEYLARLLADGTRFENILSYLQGSPLVVLFSSEPPPKTLFYEHGLVTYIPQP